MVELKEISIDRAVPLGTRALLLSSVPLAAHLDFTYSRPGQYVQLRLPRDERPRFIALCSGPGEAAAELLLQFATEQERDAQLGLDRIESSTAQGRGYTLPGPDQPEPVWMFAQGSGIAPLRATWRTLRRDDPSRPLSLRYGARNESEIYFVEEWAQAAREHDVLISLSQGTHTWPGARGYVQTHLPHSAAPVWVLVCGTPVMQADVEAQLTTAGQAFTGIFTNF